MTIRYSGNGIYKYIIKNNLNNYVTFTDKEWLLLYGDENSKPKLMAYVYETESMKSSTPQNVINNGRIAYKFSKLLDIPIILIHFAPESTDVDVFWDNEWETNSYAELANIFSQFNLLRKGYTGKDVNRYLSSDFHAWQRNTLGNITVSDFDLLQTDINGLVTRVFELKRSFYELEYWKPFREDYKNFALLINVLRNTSINLNIIYNQFKNGVDYISKVKLFEFECPETAINKNMVVYEEKGVFSIDSILN